MNISYYQRPFPYSIIDNFFDEDMLREVTKATSEQDIGLNKFTDESVSYTHLTLPTTGSV